MRDDSKFADSLASRIGKLKKQLGLSQRDFARKLSTQARPGKKVTQSAVSKLEKGLYKPSADMLIRLGNLAQPREASWFYGEAGIETTKLMQEMERKSRDLHAKRNAPPALTEVVQLPLIGGDKVGGNKLEEAGLEASESVFMPALLVPNPASTVCVRVSQRGSNPIFHEGDVAVIDGYDTHPGSLFQRLVAVYFDRLPNSLLGEPRDFNELRRTATMLPSRSPTGTSTNADEIIGRMSRQEGAYALKAGTFVGWITRQFEEEDPDLWALHMSEPGERWRLVLRAASVRGFTSGSSAPLTDWSTEDPGPSLRWKLSLVKGARILGEVISWMKLRQAPPEQEPK